MFIFLNGKSSKELVLESIPNPGNTTKENLNWLKHFYAFATLTYTTATGVQSKWLEAFVIDDVLPLSTISFDCSLKKKHQQQINLYCGKYPLKCSTDLFSFKKKHS